MFHGVGFDRPAGRFEEKMLREMLDGTGRTRSASPASSPNGLTSPGGARRTPLRPLRAAAHPAHRERHEEGAPTDAAPPQAMMDDRWQPAVMRPNYPAQSSMSACRRSNRSVRR